MKYYLKLGLLVLLVAVPYALLKKQFLDSSFIMACVEGVLIVTVSSIVGSYFRKKKEDDECL